MLGHLNTSSLPLRIALSFADFECAYEHPPVRHLKKSGMMCGNCEFLPNVATYNCIDL